MTQIRPPRLRTLIGGLWKRAPLWRFVALSAGLCTLLFELYPPVSKLGDATPAVDVPPPSYVSQLRPPPSTVPRIVDDTADLPHANPAPSGPGTAVTSLPTAAVSLAAQPLEPPRAPVAVAPLPTSPPISSAVPAKSAAAVAANGALVPQTATLSLAVPSGSEHPPNSTGLDYAITGRLFQGSMQLNGFRLPLLVGDWALLANAKFDSPMSTGSVYFLGRIEKKHLRGAIVVYALRSKPETTEALSAFSTCAFANAIFSEVEDNVPKVHQSCWIVHDFYTPPWQQWGNKDLKLNNLFRAAAGNMTANGVTYPQDFLAVEFLRNEVWGTLDVAYLFDPAADGLTSNDAVTWMDSDWAAANITRYPEKMAYAEKGKLWGAGFWPQYKQLFAAGR